MLNLPSVAEAYVVIQDITQKVGQVFCDNETYTS